MLLTDSSPAYCKYVDRVTNSRHLRKKVIGRAFVEAELAGRAY